ncbi:MAG: hypothetical protein ACRD0N_12020 [Acidimicrobiales bacterium]
MLNKPQRVLTVVALGVALYVLHLVGADNHHRQEDPSLNVILLFRLRVADLGLLAIWFVSSRATLHRWSERPWS